MTSIVDVLTPDYVLQIADNRPVAGASASKAIFVDGAYVLSFTGMATIAGVSADDWLIERLAGASDKPMSERLQSLAADLTVQFKTAAPGQDRRFAVVGVGWFMRPEGFRPVRVAVSNFHGASGWLSKALPQFDVRHAALPAGETLLLSHAGTRIPETVSRPFEHQLRKMARDGADATTIGGELAGLVELIAAHSHTAGRRITLASVPRADVERLHAGGDLIVTSDAPNLQSNAFLSYDPGARVWEQIAPHVLAKGALLPTA